MLAVDAAPSFGQAEVLNTQVLNIRGGENCGRTRRDANGRERAGDNFQACAEHGTVAALNGGKSIVMFRLASADELAGVPIFDRAQLACTSVSLLPTGPVVNKDIYVTHNDGNQYRNAHASVAVALDNDYVAAFYNYRPNGQNTQRYVQVFDKDCNSMSDQTRVMANNNDDMCASAENYSHQVTYSSGNEVRVVATCGGNGNNDDDGWVYETKFTKQADGRWDAQRTWRVANIQQEERTRQTATFIPTENLFVACASVGNTQPTNKGVMCTGIDTSLNGEVSNDAQSRILWKQYVARREGRIYQTQIKLAPSLIDPSYAIASHTTIEKTNRRGKGQSTLNMERLHFTRAGMDIMALPVSPADGTDATHRAMVSIPYGVDGQQKDAFVMVSTSLNGSPNTMATGQIYTWDDTNLQFVKHRKLSLNSAIDNQWISNIYGNNPNTQGRNHVQSVVFDNPYYGDISGYMPKVKTFLATAATPRRMREGTTIAEDKLSFELLLTPVVWAPEVVAPEDPADPIEPTEPDPTDPDPTDPDPTPTPDPSGPNSGSTVGACSAGTSTGTGLASFALLGLAFLGATRRRRD